MPMTTFLTSLEKIAWIAVADKEVNELFQKLRKKDNRYYLHERICTAKRLFKEPLIEKFYSMYFDYLAPESNWDIQMLNFHGGENSIHTVVNKAIMCNFLMGMVNGIKIGEEKCLKKL